MTTAERENRRKKVARRRLIITALLFFCILLLTLVSMSLSKKIKEQNVQLIELQKIVTEKTQEVNDILTLKSGPDTLVYGIIEEYAKNITVETAYPIVVYQAIAKDGTVLLNDVYQYTGTAKLHSFEIKDLSLEVGELRFAVFDKDGNQLAARRYYF